MATVVSFYDTQVCWRWHETIRPNLQVMADSILRNTGLSGRNATIVELGSGDGALLQAFSELGCTAIGVERSEAAVQRSRLRDGLNTHHAAIDGGEVDKLFQSADLVLAVGSFVAHLSLPERRSLFQGLSAHLKRNATFLCDIRHALACDEVPRVWRDDSGIVVRLSRECEELLVGVDLGDPSAGATIGVTSLNKPHPQALDAELRRHFSVRSYTDCFDRSQWRQCAVCDGTSGRVCWVCQPGAPTA